MPAAVLCAKCRRPLTEQAKRCLYCGTPRIVAAPGTPEYEVEKKATEEDTKRLERQKAAYSHGMGLGKSAGKPSLADRLRNQSFPVRLTASLLAIPLLMIWPPWAIKWVKSLLLD